MAPKRVAPPPPVDSSEETASGSGTDDSEEIALSSPAVTPRYAPPPQKVQQPESSDEEEEDEEEEEEEEEEETKLNPPAATQKVPPKRVESESDEEEEEEEETDDEAQQLMDSPKQVTEVNGGMPPPPTEDEKPAEQIQRALSKDDEIRILEVLATHRRENGTLPQGEELEAVLAGSLDVGDYDPKELMRKLKYMKGSYTRTARNGVLIKDGDSRFFDLCKEVWGGGDTPANGTAPRDFNEISQMYPFLGEEIKQVEKTHPGLFKRQYSMITDEKAHSLDQRIKKQRMSQIKRELRRSDVIKEVTKTLMGLVK